jgi:hypothetical protein
LPAAKLLGAPRTREDTKAGSGDSAVVDSAGGVHLQMIDEMVVLGKLPLADRTLKLVPEKDK